MNGRIVWLGSWKVHADDVVTVDESTVTLEAARLAPQWDMRWVLADLGDIVAINKPSGLRSEPRFPGDVGDLQTLARRHLQRDDLVPAHRLDRDTSGIVVLTRPGPLRRQLNDEFAARRVHKRYVAAVGAASPLADEGTIRARLGPHPDHRDRRRVVERGGEAAVTQYRVRARWLDRWLVDLVPHTGRTHQLRVHLAHAGAPILGDRLYGDQDSAPRLMLHSCSTTVAALDLDFSAPEPVEFAPTPANS